MNKENPKVLNDFLSYLIAFKNYSKETIKAYNVDLILFFKFLIKYFDLEIEVKDINIFILASVKESDIIAFLVYLNYHRDNCFKTRQRKVAAIKTFYRWLFSHYPAFYNRVNPTKGIPHIEVTDRLPKCLQLEVAKKLQHIFNITNSRNAIRNNTIITLFLNCGLRLSELISINIKDIDFNKNILTVIGKGNKERTIYLNKRVLKAIKLYLSTKKVIDLNSPLFVDNRDKRITKFNVEKICRKAYKLAGLEEYGYTVHSLRHTAAKYLYQSTKDILVVKKFLGHERLDTTQLYMHLDNEELKKAVDSNPLSNYFESKEKVA